MNKQIDEMAKAIFETGEAIEGNDLVYASLHGADADSETKFMRIARHLYRNGYRKASDVAREIFEEIEVCFAKSGALPETVGFVDFIKFAKLRKKYESEGADDE